jgi:hypothetical protein
MSTEPEIMAMDECYRALGQIDDKGKIRVIQWLIGRFDLSPNGKSAFQQIDDVETIHVLASHADSNGSNAKINAASLIEEFESVADIFAACDPKTDADKVLVVGAFLQIKNKWADFAGFDVQKELKNLGHGVTNITVSTGILEDKKPKLLIQTKKEGKSKQSRKKYKVTVEGINYVSQLLKKEIHAA